MNYAEEADAIAAEVLTPGALKKIEQAITAIRGGQDPQIVLGCLYGFAHMEGMLAMAKVGLPQ